MLGAYPSILSRLVVTKKRKGAEMLVQEFRVACDLFEFSQIPLWGTFALQATDGTLETSHEEQTEVWVKTSPGEAVILSCRDVARFEPDDKVFHIVVRWAYVVKND
jgi:hypothetical protein